MLGAGFPSSSTTLHRKSIVCGTTGTGVEAASLLVVSALLSALSVEDPSSSAVLGASSGSLSSDTTEAIDEDRSSPSGAPHPVNESKSVPLKRSIAIFFISIRLFPSQIHEIFSMYLQSTTLLLPIYERFVNSGWEMVLPLTKNIFSNTMELVGNVCSIPPDKKRPGRPGVTQSGSSSRAAVL